jgi:hypothetical protein
MPVSEPNIDPGSSEYEPEIIIGSVTRGQHFSTHATNTVRRTTVSNSKKRYPLAFCVRFHCAVTYIILISNIFFQIHKHNAEYGEHKKVILRLKHP